MVTSVIIARIQNYSQDDDDADNVGDAVCESLHGRQ